MISYLVIVFMHATLDLLFYFMLITRVRKLGLFDILCFVGDWLLILVVLDGN